MFKRLDPFGNPNVGVYARATSSHLFLPPGLTEQNVSDFREALGLEVVTTTVGGSTLVGSLVVGNRNGVVVADFVRESELEVLRTSGVEVLRLKSARLNAAGNNILVNDRGAVCHPDLPKGAVRDMQDALGVEVVRGEIAGIATIGTAAVANNRGVLCHPLATDEELSFIKGALHAPARIGTVNHGHGLVGAGISANDVGVVAGSRTTGIELGRIEDALGFLE